MPHLKRVGHFIIYVVGHSVVFWLEPKNYGICCSYKSLATKEWGILFALTLLAKYGKNIVLIEIFARCEDWPKQVYGKKENEIFNKFVNQW